MDRHLAPGLAATLLAALAALPGASHGHGPAAPIAAAEIAGMLARYRAQTSAAAPALSARELAELASGEFVIRLSGEAAVGSGGEAAPEEIRSMGLVGLQVIEAPRLLLWLSVMGGNDERDYRLTRATFGRSAPGSYVRYQHVDLPWPVRDRHWVIDCHKNAELAAATDGVVWEHYWSLHEDGPALLEAALEAGRIPRLSRDDLQQAVYLPANSGAWTLIDAGPNRTLVIAYVDADLGGYFPDPLVRAFTKKRLKAGFELLAEMATRVHLNYDEMPLIHDGHGNAISSQDAVLAAMRWRDEVQIVTSTN